MLAATSSFECLGLVTNHGKVGTRKREGMKSFTPTKKEGWGEVLAMLKGGHTKFWGSSYTVA